MQAQTILAFAGICCLACCVFGERFEVTSNFELGALESAGQTTAADMKVLAGPWGFEAGGTISGSIAVDPPAGGAGVFGGDPVVLVRLVVPTTYESVSPLPTPSGVSGDGSETPEQLQEYAKRLQRANCAFPSLKSSRLNASNSERLSTTFEWNVETALVGMVVVQQCTNYTVTTVADITLLNKGGVHSSAEVVPLLNLYATAAILHVLILGGFIANLWHHRHGRVPPRVLLLFVAVMVFKTFAAVVSVMRYLRLRDAEDQTQAGLDATANFFNFCADIALVLTLMLLCTGYTTVRKKLRPAERNGIIAAVVLYSAFRLGSFICSAVGQNLEQSCQGIVASDALIRFGCIAIAVMMLFRLIAALLNRLSAPWAVNLIAMRRDGDPNQPPPEPLTRFANLSTLRTLHTFKWPFVVYAMIPGVRLFVTSAILNEQEQLVTAVIQEFSVLYVFVIVGWHFTNLRPNETKKRRRDRSPQRAN
jgi:hypothetical protein